MTRKPSDEPENALSSPPCFAADFPGYFGEGSETPVDAMLIERLNALLEAERAGAKVLGGFEVGDGAKVGSNAVVVKPVPAGATAVGNPARVIEAGKDEAARAREAKAEQMGFTAYGVTRDLDDPVSKALHGLLDHAVETDRRICVLVDQLVAAGIRVEGAAKAEDAFDPQGLGKMVD